MRPFSFGRYVPSSAKLAGVRTEGLTILGLNRPQPLVGLSLTLVPILVALSQGFLR